MAAGLDISQSSLTLMERNQRPLAIEALIKLTGVDNSDPRDFTTIEDEHPAGEIERIFAVPLFRQAGTPRAEVPDVAENAAALLAADFRLSFTDCDVVPIRQKSGGFG